MIELYRLQCPDCESQSVRKPHGTRGRYYCQGCNSSKDQVTDLKTGRLVSA